MGGAALSGPLVLLSGPLVLLSGPLVLLSGLLVLLSACNAAGGSGSTDRTLDVLAAASLTETFTELADRFERDHPGVRVRLVFDSSATLAEQVNQGAPGDVLATADEATMATVVDAGNADGDPEPFATNALVLVTPPDNPGRVTTVADLDRSGVDYVTCVPAAPCGGLARTVLSASGVTADPASEEVDVKAVLTKVSLDEADAGLVYATDAEAAGDRVRAFEVPAAEEAVTRYPVARLVAADHPALAAEWVDLVLSEQGQRVLRDAGFGPP